ncbi:MAG: type II toxin-antitoxin system Phd/YefM family antitoxin [Thiobacillus sp.]|nr:type II toxin-antitoxin system Phd/YefM family antitoxin [Thiobacillus sp.]
MAHADWSLQDAKNKFSTVVDAALEGTPQRVSRRGRPAVVVLSAEEYERLRLCDRNKAPSFNELLLDMPRDDGAFDRAAANLRDVEF